MKKIRCPTHPEAVDFELEATKSNANTRSPETAKLAIINRERGSMSPSGLRERTPYEGEEQHIRAAIGAEGSTHLIHPCRVENYAEIVALYWDRDQFHDRG